MNSFTGTRHRRNLLDLNGFSPIHFPVTSFSTSAHTKEEMKHTFVDSVYISKLHLISDPLKKNLADSVISSEKKVEKMTGTKEFMTNEAKPQRAEYYPSLAGITGFISGVFNIMGGIFHKRAPSPTSQYHDCLDNYDDHQMAPSWQSSKTEVQNKIEQEKFASNGEVNTNLEIGMNIECRIAANHCEDKINQVRLLLSNNHQNNVKSSKFRPKRPRKAFIEAGTVEESFEDAFSPEDFISLSNETYIECYSPYNCHNNEFLDAEAPKVKTELSDTKLKQSMEIVNDIPTQSNKKDTFNEKSVIKNNNLVITKEELISSVENKLSEIKALLQSRCKNNQSREKEEEIESEITKPIPICGKQPELNSLPNETIFGEELHSSELHDSQDNCFFNEVTGKFFPSSVESDDSFQIIFSDGPQDCRRRAPSECESEDSFIVFEESPNSCYMSQDVFDEESVFEDNNIDSDSDIEEDSGITCKLSHNLSQTFGDLTDDSLYSCDVVDSVKANEETYDIVKEDNVVQIERTGSLLDEKRKIEKRQLPPKKVTFSSEPPKVHVMRVWAYAARQARAGHWERYALDRERFKRRIADVEMAISWVLKRQHRSRIVFQRFRPWWNAEARRELAEKKAKEEREAIEQKLKETEVIGNASIDNPSNNAIDNEVNVAEESETSREVVTNFEEIISDLTNKFDECMKINDSQLVETEQAVENKIPETIIDKKSGLINGFHNYFDDSNTKNLDNDLSTAVNNTHNENGVELDLERHNNCKQNGTDARICKDFNILKKLNGFVSCGAKPSNKTHDIDIRDT